MIFVSDPAAAMIAQVSQTRRKCSRRYRSVVSSCHPVLTVQDRVQEQIMDTRPGTLAKTWFDSPAKRAYTLSDKGKDQFLVAQWP
jgi:hypothetical protein